MAVFRKFLSATKNKMKSPKLKIEGVTEGTGGACGISAEEEEEFQQRKQQWQGELDDMSEFLVLKSTEEQKEDGVDKPVDTAYIEDRDGMPVLKAIFDVHHFTPDQVHLSFTDDNHLILEARANDDRDVAVFKKTMLRRMELPKHVDTKMVRCDVSKEGVLTIEMPFHLPPQRRPEGPSVVPITDDGDGRRKIRFTIGMGQEFCSDDIKVDVVDHKLTIEARYDVAIGKYGEMCRERDFKKEFAIPETIEVDSVNHAFSPDGRLFVELTLKPKPPYVCDVTTEDITDDLVQT
ncbi:hypothetical protein CAPTEDRAFT_224386 [Capitella teleta]|uniref:SHSP domain-containing protein n=1 Tax=Capitella teleta TaxID=283909 RepID=R7USK8_CAPTE|nr:hypothetical protein CAPTEDRAFT_224386 [Capitella teleta]|eukprot:ELU09185.1 hypothetical protein CAPTEDRAFT_224386 [Capitella teleta]